MQSMAPYQRKLILALLVVILTGLTLTVVDRQRQALSFDIRGFLDGYKHTKVVDTTKVVVKASTNAMNLPEINSENKPVIININNADIGQLQTLPGIGPVLAQNIVAHRDLIGQFIKPEDLLNVNGIGHKKLQRIMGYIEF